MVRKEIKRKIIAGIDKNELVLLKFSEKDKQNLLKWEHSKEFEYLGEMYDVVETNTVGDTTFYWCWWDYEETKLNKQLSKLVHAAWGENPLNRENNKRLFAFFKLLFYTDSENNSLFAVRDSECESLYTTEQLPSPPRTPLVPPPKMA